MSENEDAGEKTEQPTEKRLREAREQGNIPRSKELATVAVFGAGIIAIMASAASLGAGGRFAKAQASIQQVRAGLITAGDPAAAQRWTSMLLMATAAGTDDPAYAGAFHALFSGLDDAEDAACRRPWLRWDQRGRTRQGLGHRHHRSLRT